MANVEKTSGNLIYYVRSNGDDGNGGLSSGDALATIQAAIDKLPRFIEHNIVIDIGNGNFDGFVVDGFDVSLGSFSIEGDLDNPTLTTGSTTGTADADSTARLCEDDSQNWTINELRGQFLYVSGEYRLIRSNDADTIYLSSPFSSNCANKSYEILESVTTIDSAPPSGTTTYGFSFVEIKHLTTGDVWDGSYYTTERFTVKNLEIKNGSSSYIGLDVTNCNCGVFERIQINNCWYGAYAYTNGGIVIFNEIFSENNVERGFGLYSGTRYEGRIFAYNNTHATTGTGIFISQVRESNFTGCSDSNTYGWVLNYADVDFDLFVGAKSNTKHGMALYSCPFIDLDYGDISNNGEYGIHIGDYYSGINASAPCFLNLYDCDISNNTKDGIFCCAGQVELYDVDGSGNGDYGLQLARGATARIDSTTSITGTDGDSTINDGNTALDWSTDFASDGDIVLNEDNGCRIERKDFS